MSHSGLDLRPAESNEQPPLPPKPQVQVNGFTKCNYRIIRKDRWTRLKPTASGCATEPSPHSRKKKEGWGNNADFRSSGKSNCPNYRQRMCGLATASNINTIFKLWQRRGPSPSSDNEPWQLSNQSWQPSGLRAYKVVTEECVISLSRVQEKSQQRCVECAKKK